MKIAFICHGNINRSAVAHIIMNDLLKQKNINNIKIFSFAVGLKSKSGNLITKTMREIALNDGLQFDYKSYRSTKASQKDIDDMDLIYVMDDKNIDKMKQQFINWKYKTRKLGKFINKNNILDPHRKDNSVYIQTYNEIYQSLKILLEELVVV